MSTNNMDARCQSIHDERYCQVFGNKQLFVEAYPIKKKYDCYLGLDKFVREYGAPDKMTYDGAQEKIGINTEVQRVMRKYEIKGHVTETKRSNKNAVEGCMRELQRRCYRTMFRTYCSRDLWNYGTITSPL